MINCRNVQSLGPPLPFGEASLWELLGVTFRLNSAKPRLAWGKPLDYEE